MQKECRNTPTHLFLSQIGQLLIIALLVLNKGGALLLANAIELGKLCLSNLYILHKLLTPFVRHLRKFVVLCKP